MSDLIKREDATAVIRKTLGSFGNSVVTEINSLSGYVTQDYARFTQESTQDLISRQDAIDEIKSLYEWHDTVTEDRAVDHIKRLPSAVCDDCIWHVCNYNKVDWDGEDGYISRSDAIGAICENNCDITPQRCAELTNNRYCLLIKSLKELPSAEPPYQYSKAYVEQIRTERDILQDMVNNMAEPKTEMVLCALADRACPFQGKEYAWCLTCPHISEEDRELVKKAVGRPTGWIPTSEGLPDFGDTFLVTVMVGAKRETDVASSFGGYIDGFWDTFTDWIEDEVCHVVAWMPLPEPYKGGEE